jgi:hypothetical protein
MAIAAAANVLACSMTCVFVIFSMLSGSSPIAALYSLQTC